MGDIHNYTSCVAQRTRYRRSKFEQQESHSRQKQPFSVIDRSEFLRNLQSRKSCDEATGSNQNNRVPCSSYTSSSLDASASDDVLDDHMDFEMENSSFTVSSESGSFELEGTDDEFFEVFSDYDVKTAKRVVKEKVNHFRHVKGKESRGNNPKGSNGGDTSRYMNNPTEVEEIVVSSGSEDNTEMEHSSFTASSDSGSFDIEGTDDEDMEVFSDYDGKNAERVVKEKDSRFKDVKVEETKGNNCEGENVGASSRFRDNTTEVEDVAVSSGEDWDEYSSSSDSERKESDEHLFSGSESEDSKDTEFVVEEDSPSVSVAESSSDSEEFSEDNIEELASENESEKSEDEGQCVEMDDLKSNDISGRMSQKPVLVRTKKRGPESECTSLSADEGKPVKKRTAKSLKKCPEHWNNVSNERGCYDTQPLKMDDILGKKKRGREGTSLCDVDDEPVKKSYKSESPKKCSEHMNEVLHERECRDKQHLKRKEGNIQTRVVTSPLSNEEEDEERRSSDLDKTEKQHAGVSCVTEKEEEKGKKSKKRRLSGPKDNVIGTMLESILGIGETDEGEALKEEAAKPSSPEGESIPLKFRFEDEIELPPEKTEFELMVDGLFKELGDVLQLECDQTDEKEEQADVPDDELNQHERCHIGKHAELYFDEEKGLICSFCKELVLESKYVLPALVNPTTGSRRNYCTEEEFLSYCGLELEGSENVSPESCNYSKGTVWDIIPGMQGKMYPHQEGIEFIWKNLTGTINLSELKNSALSGGGGCIISHAPGTGKTKLTIMFLETFLKIFPNSRPIIVAPVSVLLTWEEEFIKWGVKFPFLNLNNELSGHVNLCLDKEFHRVLKIQAWTKGRSVLGLSYNLFEKLAGEKNGKKMRRDKVVVDKNPEMLRSILLEMPGLVVLDEGHTARNQRSRIWNALSNLKTEKCVILSGTPFQNNFRELFNTLSLVRPAIADNLQKRAFDGTVRMRSRLQPKEDRVALNSRNLDKAIEKLKAEIAPFVHVHKGSILEKNLPGLRDYVVLLNPARLQENLIEALETFKKKNTFEIEHKVALVSVHPSLVLKCKNLSEREKSAFDRKQLGRLRLDYDEGVKTRFVMQLVRLSKALGEKVLVFSQYVCPLELIKDHLIAVFHWSDGREVLHLGGKIDQKHRQEMINDFNDPNSEAKVMLASTKCCSEGIHLVGASRVVLLDVVWNPSVERQAISRAYRLGQKKVVYTYHLITSGTTEGEKYCRQAQKDRISELVFSASSLPSSTTMEGTDKQKDRVKDMDDKILEDMVGQIRLKDMFKKIIYQPKETNLIESFGSD